MLLSLSSNNKDDFLQIKDSVCVFEMISNFEPLIHFLAVSACLISEIFRSLW